jgi:hypothetical protein
MPAIAASALRGKQKPRPKGGWAGQVLHCEAATFVAVEAYAGPAEAQVKSEKAPP